MTSETSPPPLPDLEAYAKRILGSKVYQAAIETALDPLPRLAKRLDRPVLIKREDQQPVFSFKIRGAFNKMASLTADEAQRGVVCASAGNHAQGVAFAGQRLGIAATIVMPRTTPGIKVRAVEDRGAQVLLVGNAFDEALTYAKTLEHERGLTFIHPFDDPDVIAGQGTVGLEILRQHADPIEAIFVPIGGGGLASGIAAFTKYLRPEIKVIGVEPVDAGGMAAALQAGRRVKLDSVGLFADGVAVREAGEETFRLCHALLDDVILVDTDAICAAIKDIFDDTRTIAEPSGALSLAGLKVYAERRPEGAGSLIAINSGANMNFDRLRHVAERAEIGEHREALLAVTIPERPGSYRELIGLLGNRAVTEFNYRYADAASAQIFLGVQLTRGVAEKQALLAELSQAGYPVVDMTDNELAKLHIRYMVGGRAGAIPDELLYRFQFPERPGALLDFLSRMAGTWDISLFHYRNHGADYGRVLAGIRVPPADYPLFERFLEDLDYPCWSETENPAYGMFLAGTEAQPNGPGPSHPSSKAESPA
ncbi:threonine ammonia-lyase, biosynthetic [Lichenihabitans sp. Uapishka_5]|uniref:threonine ammonia-lyase, biosynthetic n=1 Tax=Lichenihabitans sp. Uapishka_5 TaxID=3037302 RepID=UPI0029E7ED23|nr:threonine ammonia-lyase, biosynthetic [Lichenihabitans sp. Uapishka_5]MDX7949687.1 threonine ammonia-lyase, biosynthetic [Lichenihabitans sp. Uapishka_5]